MVAATGKETTTPAGIRLTLFLLDDTQPCLLLLLRSNPHNAQTARNYFPLGEKFSTLSLNCNRDSASVLDQ